MSKAPFLLKITFFLIGFCACKPNHPVDLKFNQTNTKSAEGQNKLPNFEENNNDDKVKNVFYTPLLKKLASKKLIYTKHAKCRMACRYIDENDIKYALKSGKINYAKSNKKDLPCPTYSVETRCNDGQKVRIVCADCDENTKIITVIDLENEFSCNCK